jgi:hypothetical protein
VVCQGSLLTSMHFIAIDAIACIGVLTEALARVCKSHHSVGLKIDLKVTLNCS